MTALPTLDRLPIGWAARCYTEQAEAEACAARTGGVLYKTNWPHLPFVVVLAA